MKKASSPPVSALAGCGIFTPPASNVVTQEAASKALVRGYVSRASLLVAAHAVSWHVGVGDAVHKFFIRMMRPCYLTRGSGQT